MLARDAQVFYKLHSECSHVVHANFHNLRARDPIKSERHVSANSRRSKFFSYQFRINSTFYLHEVVLCVRCNCNFASFNFKFRNPFFTKEIISVRTLHYMKVRRYWQNLRVRMTDFFQNQ